MVCTAIDALIVAIETQDRYLGNKKTWTRKIYLVTDGENPIEVEDWEATAKKMNALDTQLVVVYVGTFLALRAVLPMNDTGEWISMTRPLKKKTRARSRCV